LHGGLLSHRSMTSKWCINLELQTLMLMGSRNPCTSHEDNTRARWHGEVDEEMVLGWHASAFLCLLGVDSSMEGHVTFYFSQRVDG